MTTRPVVFVFVFSCTLFVPASASASDVDTCIASADRGQSDRREGRLVDARAKFIMCSDASCPAEIRADCTRWLDDVEARIPTISVRVTAEDGADLAGDIVLDGVAIARVDASRALRLDPGAHRIAVEREGFERVENTFTLVEGERGRLMKLVLHAPPIAPGPFAIGAPPAQAEPPPKPLRDEAPVVHRSPSALVWMLGGVGVAALGSFAFFAATGHADANDLRGGCGATQTCDPSDVDAVRGRYVAADVSLGVGVVALAAAAVLWAVQR